MDELLAALIECWNEGDATRFASLFTESADYVTGQGSWIRGREEVAGLLISGQTESVILNEGPSVRLYADVASAVFTWRSASGARRGVDSLVAIRDDDGWRIDRLQNTDE